MIKEIRIERVEDLIPLLSDQPYRPDLDRNRSLYVYRGMANASFSMITSLRRNCKELQRTLEPAILKNFAKYAVMEDPTIAQSVWRQMFLGQHHGLPTRLLDWTRSPLVALHFAVTETNLKKLDARDCAVWRMTMTDMNRELPEKYRRALEETKSTTFSVELLTRVAHSIAEYDEDMGTSTLVNLEPPSISQRIINQYSFFSVIPAGITDIEAFLDAHTRETVKYVISKDIRWDIRDLLDQMNVNERIIYPGLDGLTKWITRHYYVRDM